MDDIVKFNAVENKIITIRSQQVILDSDVAELYGVPSSNSNIPSRSKIKITASKAKSISSNTWKKSYMGYSKWVSA